MPIFSLSSDYGIGTMGKEAYEFIQFLKDSKQSYWQLLPLGPTSYGDSPYCSPSIYAGNPYLIDLDQLIEEDLLTKEDVKDMKNLNQDYIDYGFLFAKRYQVLEKAYRNYLKQDVSDFISFKHDNKWLDDYSLFMAIKKKFKMVSWLQWPDKAIRFRNKKALQEYQEELKDDIDFYSFLQYLFFKQYDKLKKYANDNGIKIIGDIPIYVPIDSVECWSEPENFMLDDQYIPTLVSGVPPDYFSKTGQLWGNPIYNWQHMQSNGYKWWIDRIGQASKIYDVIRIDHFRGFESYWAIPYGEKTAINGKWIKGPDMDLLDKLKGWFYNVEFIAEDLGYHTKEVQDMLDNFGFPGMKVLQFSFDSRDGDGNAPYTYPKNSVCYVGTHDNSTAMGFLTAAKRKDVLLCQDYLNHSADDEFNWTLIKGGMASNSDLFICQMQDYLGLDDTARINTPATLGINWKWRMNKKALTKKLANKIAKYTIMYGRGN